MSQTHKDILYPAIDYTSEQPADQSSAAPRVLVFKTNLKTKQDVGEIAPLLDSLDGLINWNVDREDCDHVLRVEGSSITNDMIINVIEKAGFTGEVLPSNPIESLTEKKEGGQA